MVTPLRNADEQPPAVPAFNAKGCRLIDFQRQGGRGWTDQREGSPGDFMLRLLLSMESMTFPHKPCHRGFAANVAPTPGHAAGTLGGRNAEIVAAGEKLSRTTTR